MRKHLWSISVMCLVLVSVRGTTLAQVDLVKIDGRFYVDLDAVARITDGSLRFEASRIVLNLPIPTVSSPTTVPPPSPADDPGLSQDFMKAGIEAIAEMREWASTLA